MEIITPGCDPNASGNPLFIDVKMCATRELSRPRIASILVSRSVIFPLFCYFRDPEQGGLMQRSRNLMDGLINYEKVSNYHVRQDESCVLLSFWRKAPRGRECA
jgi:hypothetical protein